MKWESPKEKGSLKEKKKGVFQSSGLRGRDEKKKLSLQNDLLGGKEQKGRREGTQRVKEMVQ